MFNQAWLPHLDISADLKHNESAGVHYAGFKPKICYFWDGNTLRSDFVLNEQYQGWPGVAHGGTLMTLLDEGMGYENYIHGLKCVTAQMQVKFRQPTPVGKLLRLQASITQKNRRLVELLATISTQDNSVTVESTASFFVFNSESVIGQRLTKAAIWALEGVIIDSKDNLNPLPGAVDLLKQATQSGIKNLVLSAWPVETQKRILNDLGVGDYVQITTGNNLVRDTVTVENLSLLMKENNLTWDGCVTIQNTPSGIAAADRLHIRCIAVPGAYHKQDLGDSDLIVDSLEKLSPLNLEHLSIVYIPQPASSVQKWVSQS